VPEPRDEEAGRSRFRSLYEARYAEVWAFVVRRLPSTIEAPDVVAEVFTTAWRRLDKVPEPPADVLWLYGVSHRVLANQRRSSFRRHKLILRLREQPPAPSVEDERPAAADIILQAIDDLRANERDALRLVVWESLTHTEAASVLGCSPNAVAIRVHRAKVHLRQALSVRGIESSNSEASIVPARGTRS
jgi:RNA polymerase sigma-70 factor (ECF subfamily)